MTVRALMRCRSLTFQRVIAVRPSIYAAVLQEAQAGDKPVLIRIETRAGHGAGVPTDKVIENYSDNWAFLLENLGMQLPEDFGK